MGRGGTEPGLIGRSALSGEELLTKSPMDPSPELRLLFHRLNNQLGIILAHAELLEAKSGDEMNRSRAAQVVAGALDAMSTVTEIRRRTMTPAETDSRRTEM